MDASLDRLRELIGYGRDTRTGEQQGGTSEVVARVRRLALAALAASGGLGVPQLEAALADPDDEVRRIAAAATATVEDPRDLQRLLSGALSDDAFQVRLEALRVYGARLQSSAGCGPLAEALYDTSTHNTLLAIDLLGSSCPEEGRASALLSALAERSLLARAGPQSWHRPAHALVALSRLSPEAATELLPAYAEHGVWQIRMYAARAAANLQSGIWLERLAHDEHHNVREAAIAALSSLQGHAADPLYIEALTSDDYQLLITASRALEGSRHPDAVPELLAALQRITAQRRETSRDPRRALIVRIGELATMMETGAQSGTGVQSGTRPRLGEADSTGGAGGTAGADLVSALQPYLGDFDSVIAGAAARILTEWTGTEHRAEPQPLPLQPFPEIEELERLAAARAVVHMRGGGTVELRLLPFEAPTNAARFARLALSGYFDGLTFHRVVPNFVIQGGSPGANEYSGAGPFTRDEISSRSHLRGTVGLSTRGRDTGDAQIFVNMVDNVRLDHNFTIYAEVVSGMEVLDAVLEGATMDRVEIVES